MLYENIKRGVPVLFFLFCCVSILFCEIKWLKIQDDINTSRWYSRYASILYRRGEDERKIEEMLKLAVSTEKVEPAAYIQYGTLCFSRGEYKLSYLYLKKGVENSPTDKIARKFLAFSALELGKWKEGKMHLQILIDEFKFYDADMFNALGIVYSDYERNYQKAEEMFKKAIELNPSFLAPYYNLLTIYKITSDTLHYHEYLLKLQNIKKEK